MGELKLRDALDEIVPSWPDLKRATSLEACVLLAVAIAKTRTTKSDAEHALLAWAVTRFGNDDPLAGAASHMVETDLAKLPHEWLQLLSESTP